MVINTLKPASQVGHDDQRGEVLERIAKEYGHPEQKDREPVKKLGKDEFFKIMVTQIQHQDPTKPYQNEQMASQMAQFSALEQMMNVNSNLEKLSESQQPLHHLGAAGLIGKYVTADSSRFVHKEGKYSDLRFDLPADAKKVRLMILNERGETVREIEYGEMKKGTQTVAWNGKRGNNTNAPNGNYMIQVTALNERNQSIPVQTLNTNVVHGVAYEGKDTVLLIGDIRKPQKILLKHVSKIVDRSQAQGASAQHGVAGAPDIDLGAIQQALQNSAQAAATPGENSGENTEASNDADEGERAVEDYVPGRDAAYAPMNMKMIQAMSQKPQIEQPLSNQEIAAQLEKLNDLTAANPNAAKIQGGARPDLPSNPSLPPSNDGGIVGNW